jgi:hypothetical protein
VGESGTLVPFSKITEASIFNDEQFWGRAARASGDSQESGRPLIFGGSFELGISAFCEKPFFGKRSLSRDCEIHRNAGFGFDCLTGLQIRLEAPLFHSFAGCRRKNRRSAEDVKVLNISVTSNQGFQYDRTLNLHLLGQKWIIRLNRA